MLKKDFINHLGFFSTSVRIILKSITEIYLKHILYTIIYIHIYINVYV